MSEIDKTHKAQNLNGLLQQQKNTAKYCTIVLNYVASPITTHRNHM